MINYFVETSNDAVNGVFTYCENFHVISVFSCAIISLSLFLSLYLSTLKTNKTFADATSDVNIALTDLNDGLSNETDTNEHVTSASTVTPHIGIYFHLFIISHDFLTPWLSYFTCTKISIVLPEINHFKTTISHCNFITIDKQLWAKMINCKKKNMKDFFFRIIQRRFFILLNYSSFDRNDKLFAHETYNSPGVRNDNGFAWVLRHYRPSASRYFYTIYFTFFLSIFYVSFVINVHLFITTMRSLVQLYSTQIIRVSLFINLMLFFFLSIIYMSMFNKHFLFILLDQYRFDVFIDISSLEILRSAYRYYTRLLMLSVCV